MRKEIILPPHLYDRIRASAGEHGGIGAGVWFNESQIPVCVHGHAWGTYERYRAHGLTIGWQTLDEPELAKYITSKKNDHVLALVLFFRPGYARVPFWLWRILLNVKRGTEAPSEKPAVQGEALCAS